MAERRHDGTRGDVPFEAALRLWLATASISQVVRLLEIVKEELKRHNLVLEYDLIYEIPET